MPARSRRNIGPPDQKADAETEATFLKERVSRSKARFLESLRKQLGIILYASRECGVARDTVYRWINTDPEFRAAVHTINEEQGDFVERKLLERVQAGDSRLIAFYAATKLAHRGYRPSHVLSTGSEPLQLNAKVELTEARQEMTDEALGAALKTAFSFLPGLREVMAKVKTP